VITAKGAFSGVGRIGTPDQQQSHGRIASGGGVHPARITEATWP